MPYGIQCNYVISAENSVNHSIWSPPHPPPLKLVCVPDSTGKQQICKLNISQSCQLHKVDVFPLYSSTVSDHAIGLFKS